MTTMTTQIVYAPWPCEDAASVKVRNSSKTLAEWFAQLDDVAVGDGIGEDSKQGACDRWPVYEDGVRVGTLFDDGAGYTYDCVDDDGEIIN
jgi:hypothetical protein